MPHDWPIPEQLFDALAELAQHHEIDQINLKNVYIIFFCFFLLFFRLYIPIQIAFTSNTLFKLGQVLNGHPTNVLCVEHKLNGEPITTETKKRQPE